MGKRFLAFFLTIVIFTLPAYGWQEPDSDPVEAKGCVVMEMDTKRVLYAHNANDKLAMASTTKIMTAWLTLEQPNLDEYFTVDTAAIHVAGSSMGLMDGDQVTLRALAHGMLLPSGNDSANAAGVRISGSTEAFVERMNERAAEIGMENTHFVTPSGLDADGHYSTAYDMALLTAHAMENPEFARIAGLQEAKLEFGNPPYTRWLKNTNKLIARYPGCIGVKTGFTDNAKRCLVSAAQRDGVTLICVTLNCADDWNIHSQLYDRYFAQLKAEKLGDMTQGLSVPVTGGTGRQVAVKPAQQPELALLPGEKERLIPQVSLKPFEFAPVIKGQYMGELLLTMDGETVFSTPLVAAEEMIATTRPKEERGWLGSLWEKIKGVF